MTKDEWLEQTTAAIKRLSDRSTAYRGLPPVKQPPTTIDDWVLYQEVDPSVAAAILLLQRYIMQMVGR